VAALEWLTAGEWCFHFKNHPAEFRKDLIEEVLIGIEDRLDRLSPPAQRTALDSAEKILKLALATVEQGK
jgi:hypothetical protein